MLTTRFGALVVVSGLTACGGEQANAPETRTAQATVSEDSSSAVGPVRKSGSGSVAATVGSGGGTLELSEGPRIEIPAGAVGAAQDYVLQTTEKTTAFLNEESEQPVGPTFAFSPGLIPEGSQRIQVSIPLASMPEGFGEPALGYEYGVGNRVGAEDSQHSRWQYENARHEGGRLVADVDSLSGMRLQFVLTNLEVQ